MPHSPSAKKRIRQYEKRRVRNKAVLKGIKKQVKATLEALEATDPAKLQEELKKAAKQLDKAASKKVIHKNQAARRKSQLARLANAKTAAAKA